MAGAMLIPEPASAGGCVLKVCGRVINDSNVNTKIIVDWGKPSSIRLLGAHKRLGGNGTDVDGFGVPPRCTAVVSINHGGPGQGLFSGSNTDFRYYKIATDQTAVIKSIQCKGG